MFPATGPGMALKFYQGVPTTHHAIFCLHCLLCQCIAFVSLWFLLPLPHCWFMVSISKYSTDCVSVFAILRVTMDTSLSCENCCPSPQSLSIRKFSVSIMATYCAVNEWLPSFGISLFVNLCSPISCLVASWWKALFINISQALNQCERKTHAVGMSTVPYFWCINLTTQYVLTTFTCQTPNV